MSKAAKCFLDYKIKPADQAIIKSAAGAYMTRGVEEKAAFIKAAQDVIDTLQDQKARIERDVVAAFKKDFPDEAKLVLDKNRKASQQQETAKYLHERPTNAEKQNQAAAGNKGAQASVDEAGVQRPLPAHKAGVRTETIAPVQPKGKAEDEAGDSAGVALGHAVPETVAAQQPDDRTWVRDIIVELIGRKRYADQIGKRDHLDKAIETAKRYMAGSDVMPAAFEIRAKALEQDAETAAAIRKIVTRLKADASQRKSEQKKADTATGKGYTVFEEDGYLKVRHDRTGKTVAAANLAGEDIAFMDDKDRKNNFIRVPVAGALREYLKNRPEKAQADKPIPDVAVAPVAKKATKVASEGGKPAAKEESTKQRRYRYGMRARPLSIGAQPKGHVAYFPDETADGNRWGVVEYDRELTDKEVSDFELRPIATRDESSQVEAGEAAKVVSGKPDKVASEGGKPVAPDTRSNAQIIEGVGKHAAEEIRAAKSYPALLDAYRRHLATLYRKDDPYIAKDIEEAEQSPWNLLSAHAGVMNAKSARAQTMRELANAVFKETGLPRDKAGSMRGSGYRIDWRKYEADIKAKTAAKPAKPVATKVENTPLESKLPGARDIAQRQANASEKFIESAMEQFDLTREQAGLAWDYYVDNKLVKADVIGGQYNLKDGRLWDGDALRNAAEANQAAKYAVTESPERKAKQAQAVEAVANAALAEAPANQRKAHDDLFARLRDGKATLEEFQASFPNLIANEDAIKAELGALTKDGLFKEFPGLQYRYKNEKKSALVDAAYDDMLTDYALGKGVSFMMDFSGGYSNKRNAAIKNLVDNTTQDELNDYAAKIASQRSERMAQEEKYIEAVKDPQTLEDFIISIRAMKDDGKTYQEARMSLTPEQRAKFDELAGEQTRGERKARADQQKTDIAAPSEAVGASEIIKTKHTKHGHDLWQFTLERRVPPDEFKSLVAKAKRLGGDYSSYSRNGAIPGWQFRTEDAAIAFRKLVAGDATAAQEVAQARRDAFAEDRGQSAVERLNEMADRLEDRADESLGRDRKVNTNRRARFAASAEAAASADKALAKTMRNIADAIQNGTTKFLDRVRQKSQVEMLRDFVRDAQYEEGRSKYPNYSEQEKHKGEPPTNETADFAKFPSYTASRSDLASIGRRLSEKDGAKKTGASLLKVADDVTAEYIKFAKENLSKVTGYRGSDGAPAIFASKERAEEAIIRSGFKGKAIVLPYKRGQNIIIHSPSAAKEKGIWPGDGDKRITLSPNFAQELIEKARANKIDLPWVFDSAQDKLKRLKAMGIENAQEFRAMLREFIALREAPKEADKIKEMERAMIGRRNDGLDFFPTPPSVVQSMIDAAELEAGMNVLEPSAGMGHIAEGIRAAGVDPDVVEMSNDRRELLEAKGFDVVGRDFMDMSPRDFTYGDVFRHKDGRKGVMRGSGGMGSGRVGFIPEGKTDREFDWVDRADLTGIEKMGSNSGYDRILMNPPFSNRRDIEHVRHAYELLRPGGRVVAIMGEGSFFGSDKKATEFRDWLESIGGTSEKLEDGTFLDPSLPVNTGVAARMVVITKPGHQVSESFNQPWTYHDTYYAAAQQFNDIPVSERTNQPFAEARRRELLGGLHAAGDLRLRGLGNGVGTVAPGQTESEDIGNGVQGVRDGSEDRRNAGNQGYDKSGGRSVSLLANGVAEDFKRDGIATLIGRQIATPLDLAAAAQVYRDPALETVRYFFVKGGNIVGQTAVSSRRPGVTQLFVGKTKSEQAAHIDDMTRQAEALDSDGVWILHNHPSGDPTPSTADITSTEIAAQEFSRSGIDVLGHVIINQHRYASITLTDGKADTHGAVVHDFGDSARYDISHPKKSHELLGQDIFGPKDLARHAKQAQVSPGQVVVVGLSGSMGIRVIAEVAPQQLIGKRGAAILRRIARQTGSDQIFVYGIPKSHQGFAAQAIMSGLVTDAVVVENGIEFSVAGKTGVRKMPGYHLGTRTFGSVVEQKSGSPTTNPHTISTLTEALGNAFRPAFIKALTATGRVKMITMDVAERMFGPGVLFSRSAPEFRSDVPNEEWLNEQVDYAKSRPRNRFGVPYMGKVTGSFRGTPTVQVAELAKLNGERGEQQNIRQDDVDWLVAEMRENGLANIGAPYIEVGYDGVPWVSEGNHRIIAAQQLGWKDMPVEIRYFDGGERHPGKFSPDAIQEYSQGPLFSRSVGDAITVDGKQRTANRKAFLEGSKIRHVVYHATKGDFSVFDTTGRSDLGAHFGTIEQANNVLKNRLGGEGIIMPVWLSLKRPLRLKDVGSFHADGIADQLERKRLLPKGEGKKIIKEIDADWTLRKKYDPMLRQIIKDAGYDGIVYANTAPGEGSGDSYIAFDPTQIKSSIGNRGTFDPTNPDIRFSKAGTPQAFYLDGITYLIADAIPNDMTEQELRGLLRHEIGVHAAHLGENDAEFKAILNTMELMRKAGNRKVIAAYDHAKNAKTPEHRMDHEALAYMVQHHPEVSLAQRFLTFFKRLVNRVLGESRLRWDYTTEDLTAMAQAALMNYPSSNQNSVDMVRNAGLAMASSEAPAWYSPLSRMFLGAKQATMPAAQWKLWLQANKGKFGVKDDEINYSGILDYLDLRGKDRVTREEIDAFLADNGVRVGDVMKGTRRTKAQAESLVARRDEIYMRHDNGEITRDERNRLLEEVDSEFAPIGGYTDETKFSGYWSSSFKAGIPGTYREILVTLPDDVAKKKGISDYTVPPAHQYGARTDDVNRLVHLRLDEVTGADGKRYVRVGEVQSDWAAKGKKEGFIAGSEERAKIEAEYHAANKALSDAVDSGTTDERIAAAARASTAVDAYNARINDANTPNAPFVTDTRAYVALGIKRAIRHAVDVGADGVVFGTGQQNADLYDLSKQVESVRLDGDFDQAIEVSVIQKGKQDGYEHIASTDKNGLADVVGKDIAKKAIEDGQREFHGLDLKVGGEGMIVFYDQIIPSVANEVLRKIGGGKVATVETEGGKQRGFAISDEMRAQVRQGLPLFAKATSRNQGGSRQAPLPSAQPNPPSGPVFDSRFFKHQDKHIAPDRAIAETKQRKALGWLAGGFTRLQLVSMYKNDMPGLIRYSALVDMQDTMRVTLMDNADAVLKTWRNLSQKESDAVADIMLDATTRKVYPDRDLTEQPDGTLAVDVFRLGGMWAALSPEAKAVYKAVEKAHSDMRTKMFHELKNRITRLPTTPELKDGLISDLEKSKLLSELSGPYFPLSRFGPMVLIATKGKEVIRSHFESAKEREQAADSLRAQGYKVKLTDTSNAPSIAGTDASSNVLVAMAEKINAATQDVESAERLKDDINQAILRLAPAGSFRRHYLHRKGTPGYSKDAMRGFADSMSSAANHITSIAISDRIDREIADMQKGIDASDGNVDAIQNVLDHIKTREQFLKSHKVHPMSAMLGQFGFLMSLGFTPAAALVNVTQTPLFTFPWMAARYGAHSSVMALAKASKDVMRSFSRVDGLENLFDVTRLEDLGEGRRDAIKELISSGDIEVTQMMDLIDAASTQMRGRGRAEEVMLKVSRVGGLGFHLGEVANRISTALAVYDLAFEKLGDHHSAIDAARTAINDTHFNYKKSNRSMFMQGNVARIVTMFKQYAQNTMFLIGRTAWLALKDESPKTRAIARKQLAYMMGMGFITAGAMGLPIGLEMATVAGGAAGFAKGGKSGAVIGAVIPLLLTALAAGFGDDDGEELETEIRNWLADNVGKTTAEIIAKGPARLLGIDISGRTDLSELVVRKPNPALEGKDRYYAWMQSLLGPVAGYGLNIFATAPQLYSEGHQWRAAEAALPKFVKDAMKAMRYEVEGVKNSRGNALIERELNAWELASQAIGFTPSVVSEAYSGNAAIRYKERVLNSQRRKLLDRFYMASKEDRAEIGKEMREFSRNNPTHRINGADILRSMKARNAAKRDTHGGVRLSDKREALRETGRFVDRQ